MTPTQSKEHEMKMPRWATVGEAAEYLRCCTRTTKTLIAEGKLTGYRLGRKMVLVDLNQVDEYVQSTSSTKSAGKVHRPTRQPKAIKKVAVDTVLSTKRSDE
jgi:excisionase family DNA binding protein